MGKKPAGAVAGDTMTIVGKDGKARYKVEGTKVRDVRVCQCAKPVVDKTGTTGPQCKTCGLRISSDA